MNLELEAYEGELKALRQAAKMALEALETDQAQLHWKIVRALRQALAQPEQEPVAWIFNGELFWDAEYKVIAEEGDKVTPLYTAPPKREWVGLTNEQIYEHEWWHEETAYAVNKFLMEKNT